MHIYSSAGLLRAGRYGDLELAGNHELESGVQFNTCTLTGSAIMRDCTGTTLMMESAHVHCEGNMHVDTLCGYGQIEVTGSLQCRCLDFTGKIAVRGKLACAQNLDVTGLLSTHSHITTHGMHIAGVILANDVRSIHMSVLRMRNAMYVTKLTDEYRTRSEVERIESQQVTLEDVSCRYLQAAYVSLRRCDVDYLAYTHSFALDSQSHVSRAVFTSTSHDEHYRRRA